MRNHERTKTSEEVAGSQSTGEVATRGLATRLGPEDAQEITEPFPENNRCHGSRVTAADPETIPATESWLHMLSVIEIDDAAAPKARGPFGDIRPA